MLTRFDQRLEFGDLKSASIDPHIVDLPLEQIRLLDPTDVQRRRRVVQIGTVDRTDRDFIPVDI